ncbi:TPT domain-containing protein [Forsythia ovata]|uniref:TPT domain-containing protein n=1 Tax=Forsythia ovata TaxID=205694 RepID=A0ABD1PFS7_9LAMI
MATNYSINSLHWSQKKDTIFFIANTDIFIILSARADCSVASIRDEIRSILKSVLSWKTIAICHFNTLEMLKALMPVAVYSIGIIFKKDSYKNNTMLDMLAISIGIPIAAYGEAKYDSWGVFLQLGTVVFEATRLNKFLMRFYVELDRVLARRKNFCVDHKCRWYGEGLVAYRVFIVGD